MLLQQGAWMDPDLNKYDLYHRVAHHPKMSDAEWEEAYRAAWHSFYSLDHIRTILRRAAANPQGRPQTTLSTLLWFKLMTLFEGVHPLEGGAFRRKSRRDRRHGLPIESAFVFYPRYLGEIVGKAWGYWSVYRQRQRDTQRSAGGARSLELRRFVDHATRGRRVRPARSLSPDARRRCGVEAQAARRRPARRGRNRFDAGP